MHSATRRTGKAYSRFVGVMSAISAASIVLSPWLWVRPLGWSGWLWFGHILSRGGLAMTFARLEPVNQTGWISTACLLLAILFGLPFLLWPAAVCGKRCAYVARAVGILLSALTVLAWANPPGPLVTALGWGDALAIAGGVIVGLGICVLSVILAMSRTDQQTTRTRLLKIALAATGLCVASFVLHPVGVFLLIPTYLLLAFRLVAGESRVVIEETL